MRTTYANALLGKQIFCTHNFFFVPFDDDDDEMTIESERERGSVRYYYFIYYLAIVQHVYINILNKSTLSAYSAC